MSRNGQTGPDPHPGEDPDPHRPVVVSSREIRRETRYDWHSHSRAQLVFAAAGLMNVSTRRGTWLVPPQQSVWLPAGVEHLIDVSGPCSVRFLYLHRDAIAGLPDEPRVLRVSPLLRSLILRLADYAAEYEPGSAAARLSAVIPDELRELDAEPLHLPLPRDKRLAAVTGHLIEDPADWRGLAEWAAECGASERTLARLFLKETGMTFGAWRQRRRLTAAVARLAEGEAVTSVALDLGYASTSAFIAMFKKELGATPGRYLGSA